jgi:adenosine deaminase
VYPTLAEHSLPRLIDSGLYVTINSDDPPMFNTTLTNEYAVCAETFGWDTDDIKRLSLNALRASFLPEARKTELEKNFAAKFNDLRMQYAIEQR